MVDIRPVRLEDAAQILALSHTLDQETQFMLFEPGERHLTVEEQRQLISGMLDSENSAVFVAEDGDQLVGFLGARGGEWRRIRHSAHLVVGILQAYTGQGIGTRLFQALDDWARQHKLHRLELTVMTHNTRAVALYQKMGFVIEGTKRHTVVIDGTYVDEYSMAKLLPEA